MTAAAAVLEQAHGVAVDQRRLLLACVRQALGTGKGPLPALRSSANWPRLLELAKQHRVVPLLRKVLCGAEWVPTAVQVWMEEYCRTIVSHNLSLASELTGVLDALQQAGVAAVPYKGPAWTKALYGNLADRQIGDLDLFVEVSEIPRACTVLEGCGYTRGYFPGEDINRKDVGFVHTATGLHLELHWSPCEPWRDRRLARLHLWTPQSTTVLLGREVALPSAENMLLLLAIHGFRDGWNSLKLVCDIAALLRAYPDLDFKGALRRAAEVSRTRLILVPLALAEQLLHVKLPAAAIARDPLVAEIAGQIERHHYTPEADRLEAEGRVVSGRIYLEWVRLQIVDNVWERLAWHTRYLFSLLAPNANDRSWFSRKLPEPVYWVLKPWRLLRSYGPARLLRLGRQFVARSAP